MSSSLAIVLMGDFIFPDVCWKYNTVEEKQSGRFLEYVEYNFQLQVMRAPLDMLFANREGPLGVSWFQLGQS